MSNRSTEFFWFLVLPIVGGLLAVACASEQQEETYGGGGSRRSKRENWIIVSQSDDGSWDGGVGAHSATVCTSLMLLTLSGAGESAHRGTRKVTRVISDGLCYLMKKQSTNGFLGSSNSDAGLCEHAIASLAICQALRRDPVDPGLQKSAIIATKFLAEAQGTGGLWSDRIDSDISCAYTSVWALMSVLAASKSGITNENLRLKDAVVALRELKNTNAGSIGIQRFCSSRTIDIAISVVLSLFGETTDVAIIGEDGLEVLAAEVLSGRELTSHLVDPAFWYFASIFKRMSLSETDRALGAQDSKDLFCRLLKTGMEASLPVGLDSVGRWSPVGKWARLGGPNYTNAMHLLALQIYYEYSFVFPVEHLRR